MTKNLLIKIAVFSAIFLMASFAVVNFAKADNCPTNTEVRETSATLVGEITDDGGDPNLEAWLQYGRTMSYGSESTHQSKYGIGLFCANISNLEPGATYHYRAVARNSAGTSYGEDKSFTTRVAQVSVDIKANNSDGPITISVRNSITLSWTSQNAASCEASGDWSGSKSTSGTQTIQLNNVRTNTFTIVCRNASGAQTGTDSVQVQVNALPPTVITKPAIVTY